MTSDKMAVPDVDHLIAVLDRVTDRMRNEVAARIDWGRKGALRPWHLAILLILPLEGARPRDLAARAGISRQAISQWIRELGDDGYLTVVTDPSDARGRIVRPTTKGRATIGEATNAIREVEAVWARQLDGDRLEQLRDTLRELRDGATR